MSVNFHGKLYKTVAERLAEAHEAKDILSVYTEVLTHTPVVIRATIETKKGKFTGISYANENKKQEKESPYEVAETSAVGRALAFAGYISEGGISSADELSKAGLITKDDFLK